MGVTEDFLPWILKVGCIIYRSQAHNMGALYMESLWSFPQSSTQDGGTVMLDYAPMWDAQCQTFVLGQLFIYCTLTWRSISTKHMGVEVKIQLSSFKKMPAGQFQRWHQILDPLSLLWRAWLAKVMTQDYDKLTELLWITCHVGHSGWLSLQQVFQSLQTWAPSLIIYFTSFFKSYEVICI